MESGYQLDDHHRFVKGKPLLVCGNSGAMVGENGVSWLSPHFEVPFMSLISPLFSALFSALRPPGQPPCNVAMPPSAAE